MQCFKTKICCLIGKFKFFETPSCMSQKYKWGKILESIYAHARTHARTHAHTSTHTRTHALAHSSNLSLVANQSTCVPPYEFCFPASSKILYICLVYIVIFPYFFYLGLHTLQGKQNGNGAESGHYKEFFSGSNFWFL